MALLLYLHNIFSRMAGRIEEVLLSVRSVTPRIVLGFTTAANIAALFALLLTIGVNKFNGTLNFGRSVWDKCNFNLFHS